MRLITTTFLCLLSFYSVGQECGFLPMDTVVCGFKHSFQMTEEVGDFYYNCEQDKPLSISTSLDGSTLFTFSECGEYEIIFESSVDGCTDTFNIQVHDPSNSTTLIDTNVELGYGDIDCPGNVIANCYTNGVSIPISSGTPDPIWSFCTTVSCQSNIYTTEVIGDITGCLADSIVCDSVSFSDSSADCVEVNQDAFIVLNSNGDMVDNNSFLEYIAQLQSELNINCPLILNNCVFEDQENCFDSMVIDTSYLHIPVRIGGKWTLANIDTVELLDTTYFEYFGTDYELILDPGVEFYGPGNLDVYLEEIFITSSNDTIRNFPYDFHLELQWVEEWILDTLEIIREIPFDSDGDCFACGGNFFNSNFNVPGIPEFPCGPVSIDYPSICDCEFEDIDYSLELIECDPKMWELNILSDHTVDFFASDPILYYSSLTTATIMYPESENIDIFVVDQNGCEHILYLDLGPITEYVHVSPHEGTLNCEIPEIVLTAHNTYFSWNGNSGTGINVEFESPPLWRLPNGGTVMGESITVSEPGDYRVEYTDSHGCFYEEEAIVIYDDEETVYYEEINLCGGETTIYNGQTIDQPGVYNFDIDCNESTMLSVVQYDFQETSEFYTICDGEDVLVHGQMLSAGYHYLDIPNGTPCPDIVNVEIAETEVNLSWSLSQNCDGSASLVISHDTDGANYIIDNDGSNIGNFTSNGNTFELQLESSGTYQVDVESNGCFSNFDLAIDLMEYQILPQEDGLLTCTNNCIQLDPEIVNLRGNVSSGDYTIQWSGPDGFTSTDQSIEVCQGGNYNMELVYGSDCTTNQTIFVSQNLAPEIQTIVADLCYGECYDDGTYTFCQTIQTTIDVDDCTRVEVDVKIADQINAEESFSICDGESIDINSANYAVEGTYQTVFVTQDGCDSTLYFSIDILEVGEVYSENIIDCTHDEAMINYTSLNEKETYVWKDEDGNILSDASNYLATKAGVYTIEITIEGGENTCTHTENFEVLEDIVYPEIQLDETHIINCESSARIEFDIEVGSTWEWTNESSDMLLENEVLETEDAGVYSLVVTNAKGCSSTKSIEIQKVDPLAFDLTTSATCEDMNGGSLELNNIVGGIAPYSIMLDGEEIETVTLDLEEGDYMLSILQSDGCILEQEVTIESIPDLDDIPVQYLEYCNSSGVQVTLDLSDELSYKWLDGYELEERQFTKEGVYDVEISNGCHSVISTYDVDDTRVDKRYLVPNIFSPDGNSTNDIMKIVPQVNVQDFKLYVFSRDGSLVFESNDPDFSWDGKIGGNNVVIGSFVWMIESSIVSCLGDIEKVQDVGTVMVVY